MKLVVALSLGVLFATSYSLSALTCSCTAPDGSCTASVTCPGGCGAFCGEGGFCRTSCSGGGGGGGGEEDPSDPTLVTCAAEGADAQFLSGLLGHALNRTLSFEPRQQDALAAFEFKQASPQKTIDLLAKSGAVETVRKGRVDTRIHLNVPDGKVPGVLAALESKLGSEVRAERSSRSAGYTLFFRAPAAKVMEALRADPELSKLLEK